MSKRMLCKFFAHGACLKGEHCEFSHDWKDQPNNICTFYQRGVCSYGSRCRYDHVKVSRPQTSVSSSSSTNSHQHLASDSVQLTHPCRTSLSGETTKVHGVPAELSALSQPFFPLSRQAWSGGVEDNNFSDDENGGESTITQPADWPICSFAAAGGCPRGERCPQIHGDLCATCGKHCLHPHRPAERDEHIKTCERNKKHLDALKHSQEIECSVCLDRVLSKPTAAERKFGLLSDCDHPFCVSCIRNWRSSSPDSGMDVNTALRACPICRKLSYFVIPSMIWYSTNEEKQEIVDSYKAKLRSIDCRYFAFGNGTCPFGTSCFYKHMYNPDTNRKHKYMPHRNRSSCVNTYAETNLFGPIYRQHVLDINDGDLQYLDDDDDDDDDDDVEYVSLTAEEMAFLLMQLDLDMCGSSSDEDN